MTLGLSRKTRCLSRAENLLAEVLWGSFASVIFALAFSYRLLGDMKGMGLDHDWDQTMEMHWVPFYTVTHFHQFPLWDPYKCGGIPLLANPSSRILTPFFLLHLLFGPLIGIHLEMIAHIAIGFGGAYLLAKLLEIGKLGAVTCGATFAGSSWYYIHLAPGHGMFMSVMYIPWVLALFWMGWQRRRLAFAAPAGLVTALIFFEGGIYQTSHLGVVLAVLAVVLTIQQRSLFPLGLLLATGFFVIVFAAPKFLPTMHLMGLYPRTVDPFEKNTFPMLLQELFSRNQFFSRDSMGGFWGFWEFGAYLGYFFASMAIMGIALRFRAAIPWLAVGIVLLALAAGNHGDYSPWVLIHRLPIFSGEHAPTRTLMPFTLCVGVMAAFGVDALCALQMPWLTGAVTVSVMIAIIDCWTVSAFNLRYSLGGGEPQPFERSPSFKQFYLEDDHRMFRMAQANLGIVDCYEPSAQGKNAFPSNQPGYLGEQFLVGKGEVTLARWTPNVLDYNVDAKENATVVVNQNYDSEWKLVKGRGVLFDSRGLLAVEIPPGKQRLELRYYSSSFLHGCMIFLVGIAIGSALFFAERRWRSTAKEGPHSAG